MYSYSAFLNLGIGALAWRKKPFTYDWGNRTFLGRVAHILALPIAFPWAVLVQLFACLPQRIQRPIRFYIRYIAKWAHHRKDSVKAKSRQIRLRKRFKIVTKKNTDKALAKTLIYDVVLLIAPKVHYVDLVNLSMASRRIRATMFPSGGKQDQEQGLRRYSCYNNRKLECQVCGIQICTVS